MRYLIVTMMYVLLANPGWVLAETPNEGARPEDKDIPELVIVGKNDGKKQTDFRFKMGESLKIKVAGNIASNIRQELAKVAGARALTLYLDDVRMTSLTVSASELEAGKQLILSVHLVRNSHDDGNRKAWDTLLTKNDGYLMKLPVALAVGNELPVTVHSAMQFEFYIASDTVIWWVLGIGLVIFLVSYYLLVQNSTAMRDVKDGPYSLGKSQMAFWGLLVALTFAGLWIVTGTMERIPPQVLILLGISGATGLSALVIGESKKVGKKSEIQNTVTKLQEEYLRLEKEKLITPTTTLTKVIEDRLEAIKTEILALKTQPQNIKSGQFWQDICKDGNGMSFHRLQVVIWTMLLGVVFVWSVAQVMSMPEFPETLLVLLGISNGTYLGFKIPER